MEISKIQGFFNYLQRRKKMKIVAYDPRKIFLKFVMVKQKLISDTFSIIIFNFSLIDK